MSFRRTLFALAASSLTVLAAAACTIASPTYVSVEDQKESKDGGSGTSSPSSSGGPRSDSGASTSCSSFVKPDLGKLTACGGGKGHCWDKAKTPYADQLTACADASQVCVPDEILAAGGGKLASCTSIIGPGGCVTSALFPEIEKQGGGVLKKDVCKDGQLCVPCNDPTNGNAATPFCQAIGVSDVACAGGPPTPAGDGGGAAPLPSCCITKGVANGVCLPETAIPADQRDDTKRDVCAKGDKCVPAAFVSNKPVACKSSFGDGVCMDRCFDDMMSIAGGIGILGRSSCGATELCIPCDFVSGQGVPGCK